MAVSENEGSIFGHPCHGDYSLLASIVGAWYIVGVYIKLGALIHKGITLGSRKLENGCGMI